MEKSKKVVRIIFPGNNEGIRYEREKFWNLDILTRSNFNFEEFRCCCIRSMTFPETVPVFLSARATASPAPIGFQVFPFGNCWIKLESQFSMIGFVSPNGLTFKDFSYFANFTEIKLKTEVFKVELASSWLRIFPQPLPLSFDSSSDLFRVDLNLPSGDLTWDCF